MMVAGPRAAYLMDCTDCSLLVARNVISDEAGVGGTGHVDALLLQP